MKILVLILCMSLAGCATPLSYKGRKTDEGLEITTEPSKLLGFFPIAGVPAGKYHYKEGDRELDIDTKTDLKLFDFNASKIGD